MDVREQAGDGEGLGAKNTPRPIARPGEQESTRGADEAKRCLQKKVNYEVSEKKVIPKRGLKYRNHIIRDPTTGKKAYDSKLERRYHVVLMAMEKAGVIRDLRQWPSVELLPGIRYKPDFYYREVEKDREVWVDTKGFLGERYRIITKIWRLVGPGILLEVKSNRGGWSIKEIKSKGLELR